MNPQRPLSVILIVVGTLAGVVMTYAITLAFCTCCKIDMPPDAATNFKEVALVALGALGSLLARTSTGDSSTPVPVVTTNTTANPVETHPNP